jgi:GDP-4-dehydro-6-deoxy-D-mannose reductase
MPSGPSGSCSRGGSPDPTRFRPVDEPVVIGDNSRLRALGWAPRVALDQSLARILDYWRGRG